MDNKVCIIGLGYVGLPLALLSSKKFDVIGIDSDQSKIDALNAGRSYIDDVEDAEIQESRITFTSHFPVISQANIIIVCVPTPVDEAKIPNLEPVKKAVTAVAANAQKGALVIIESTVNPGVCDDIIVPILENSGLNVGTDIHIAHCPERINPGDKKWNVSNINRVVGSSSDEGLEKAYDFYRSIIDADIKKMQSLKEAEAVKVVENTFRDINIAFVNELAMSFHALDINIENVIEGASTKPFGFMPHHPGIGVGGHCIPVDPYYLIEYANGFGFQHRFLSLAREINEGMPAFTFSLLKSAEQASGIVDKQVTLLGLSYKANVGDLRESPSLKILNILKEAGYKIDVYDPFFEEQSTIANLHDALRKNSSVVLATNHSEFSEINPTLLKDSGVSVFIDGRNALYKQKQEFLAEGVTYKGIGT